MKTAPAIWFPTIRAGTGADIFTERLAVALEKRGIRTQISWLPHRAEFLPWSVALPQLPVWATVVHINSRMHRRFIPKHLPVVTTFHSCVHDPVLDLYKTPLQKLYHRGWVWQREREAIDRAELVTAVSRYTATKIEQIFLCDGIVPIYNWIDTEKFSPSERRDQHKPFRLLFVGNASRRLKGADLLAGVMRLLGDDYQLRFTGSFDDLGGVADLPPNIIAVGHLNTEREIVAAYQSCDALLFPTRLEGFGLVALEAQACGLPVVATRCSSLPEVVEHGVTGQLCIQDDIQSFADAIRNLRETPEKWAEMRLAARQRALTSFSEQRTVEQYLTIYRRLLSI